ncbi:MAG TPA: GNAT family N-acetyltransferase [Tahibacter sp.]|nr:GNAT family N-acetyltransferase [Tahibacter sp.]
MSTLIISPATPIEADAIRTELQAFNRRAVGEIAFDSIAFATRDASGALIGGFLGDVYLGWLAIDVLWVAQSQRGSGLGSALLERAEREASHRGAKAAYLDTFEWQAAGFYAKHGYREFGRLADFPDGMSRIFMRKTFAAAP